VTPGGAAKGSNRDGGGRDTPLLPTPTKKLASDTALNLLGQIFPLCAAILLVPGLVRALSTDTPPVPQSFSGVFSPGGDHFVGQWWFDSAPDVKYGLVGTIINAGPGRSTGDENISTSTCETDGYYREVFTGPLTYNGYVNAYRRDTYSGLDPGAPISESHFRIVLVLERLRRQHVHDRGLRSRGADPPDAGDAVPVRAG